MVLVNPEKIPYSYSGVTALMEDGARISWGNKNLTCTCVTAKRCARMDRQMCKHIVQVLRDRNDRIILPSSGTHAVQVCMMLPLTPDMKPQFISIQIDAERKRVLADNFRTLFILSGHESRADLRDALIPFLMQEIMEGKRSCAVCDIPISYMELAGKGSRMTARMSAALADLLSIYDSGKCVKHNDLDLIPF